MENNVFAVIMAGGSGTRLWPMSRKENPKQFIDFFERGTMIQETVWRLKEIIPTNQIYIITNHAGKELACEQIKELPVENILVEPSSKNTAPCIALTTAIIRKKNPNAVVITLPSDHLIGDDEIYYNTLKAAVETAKKTMSLCIIGIKPTRAETGFGYIQQSSEEAELAKKIYLQFGVECKKVKTFAEKPDKETAILFYESNEFYWNSGMFIWHVDAISQEFKNCMPDLYQDMEAIYQAIGTEDEKAVIDKVFTWVKSISIDYGVLEKAKSVYFVVGQFSWSDGGSWDDLAKIKTEQSNVIHDDLILENSSNVTLLKTNHKKKIAVIGINDIIIVETEEAILFCKRGESQKVKHIVERLKEKKQFEYL